MPESSIPLCSLPSPEENPQMPYRDLITWTDWLEILLLTLIPAALAFWRDLVSELDKPTLKKHRLGATIYQSKWYWFRRRFYQLTYRLGGGLIAGFVLSEICLHFELEGLSRVALVVGGVGGWKFIDAWGLEVIKRIRQYKERSGQDD